MDKKIIVVSASGFSVGTLPGDVALMFHELGSQLGLAPDMKLTLRLSPDEARQIATALARKADEAEARTSQPNQLIHPGHGTKQ